MIEGIPLDLVGYGSGWAVVVLGVIMIFRGVLHTDKEVQQLIATHTRELDDISHDRDEWRAAHRLSEQARVEERENNRDFIGGLRAVREFFEGFRKAAAESNAGQEGS